MVPMSPGGALTLMMGPSVSNGSVQLGAQVKSVISESGVLQLAFNSIPSNG